VSAANAGVVKRAGDIHERWREPDGCRWQNGAMSAPWRTRHFAWLTVGITVGASLILIGLFLPARPTVVCPPGHSFMPCIQTVDARHGLKMLLASLGGVAFIATLLIDRGLSRPS